jgi:hypothetical protein
MLPPLDRSTRLAFRRAQGYRPGMRTVAIGLVILGALGVIFSCGDGGSGGGTKTPDTANSAGGGSGGSGGSSDDASSGPPSTTVMVGDGGELQGTKLQSSGTVVMQGSADAGPSGAGESSSEPGRKPEDIMTIIKTRRDDFRACYDAQLKAHPTMKGNIDLEWVVDPKGNVSSAKINESKSQILIPEVTDCMIKVLKAIKFADSKKGFETRMHYPFNFNPGGAPKKP